MTAADAPALIGFAALGTALGLAHFATLRRLAALYAEGGTAKAAALLVGRWAVLAGALVWIASHGAAPLLSAAAGILAGRAIVLALGRG